MGWLTRTKPQPKPAPIVIPEPDAGGTIVIGGAETEYFYREDVEKQVWTINHNLSKYPKHISVRGFDEDKKEISVIIPDGVSHISNKEMSISFSRPMSGSVVVQ